jgi:16S rRNA G527 N7-methylase RsmG
VEEFPAEPPFDGVISRAFASLNDMVSWCHHLPAEKGRFYALKGQRQDEIDSFRKVLLSNLLRNCMFLSWKGSVTWWLLSQTIFNFYQKMWNLCCSAC